MNHGYSGGKRQREANRAAKKKDKEERLRKNRAARAATGDPDMAAAAEPLPEVKLEDVIVGVPKRPKRASVTPSKLFVGGLSWDTTSEGLRAAFAGFGTVVEATLISDRNTGRSRGFGFVSFERDEDGEKAVAEMNGAQLDGRTLKVTRADSR